MGWQTTLSGTSPLNQRVEYRQNPGNGVSMAESEARVVVSGNTVVRGWSSDGKTYAAYARIVAEGYRPEEGDSEESEPEKVHEEFGRQQLDDQYFEPPFNEQP